MFNLICNLLVNGCDRVYIVEDNGALHILSDFDKRFTERFIDIDFIEVNGKSITMGVFDYDPYTKQTIYYNEEDCEDLDTDRAKRTEFVLDYYDQDPINEYKRASEIACYIANKFNLFSLEFIDNNRFF